MENEEVFLHTYFNHLSQMCYEKAKDHVEKEKNLYRNNPLDSWFLFMNFLHQLSLVEKNYMELGFLQGKNKSFLRKDSSGRAAYDALRNDLRRLEESSKNVTGDKKIQNYCQNIYQFLTSRMSLIDLYEEIYTMGVNRCLAYKDMLTQIEAFIDNNTLSFTDITLTPMKATFNLECKILEQLLKALTELQKLQFLPSLALIHGAHTRLSSWETKLQNREVWKLGFFKNTQMPLLFQWLQKFKGTVLSKFSLYFHDILAQQTTPNDMRSLCSNLYHDHYQKIVTFVKKNDAACVILLSDNQCGGREGVDYDSFSIIVSYPPRSPPQLETILKMITEISDELSSFDKIVYKISAQGQCTYTLTLVEPNIYLVILFKNKKSEKDVFINNFITELCTNLRCTKLFMNLKNPTK